MAYLALYREWRPKKFKEIVGQEHVTTTLINALKQNKVAHAYLFSGPRGTGKTTAAKILAKALNCTAKEDVEPCNKCSSCQEIDQGLALDVLEIDAASNRGIDEIRDLREKVKLASSGGKYKVYIVDEVHMLTTEAFNALLKTLEEPPANVVFVLATTEAHKVPLTILSRVQRFEFHRIPTAGIVTRLQEVCISLGRNIEEKALWVIAARAEGGLRDALSILDQCLLQEDPIRIEHVYQVIGMVGESYSADLTDTLIMDDYGLALAKLDEGIALGRDPRQIIKELLDYFRQMLLYVAGGQEPLLSPEMTQRLMAQSKKIGLRKILSWINVVLKGEGEFRYAANARLAAEMILVQTLYEQSTEVVSQQANQPDREKHTSAKGADIAGTQSPKRASVKEQKVITKQSSALAEQESDFPALIAKWPEILEEVKKIKRSTQAFLLEGKPAGLQGEMLYLVFKDGYSFHKDKFSQAENKNVVERVLEQFTGKKLTLISMMESEYEAISGESGGTHESSKAIDGVLTENTSENQDSCVQKAVEYFGKELVEVTSDK